MQLRTLLTILNFASIGITIVILIEYPSLAPDVFYVLLGWIFGSLALIYSPWAARPVTGTAPPRGPSVSADVPLVSPASPQHASALGFCLYCATPIEPGTARCPACGRALPHFA
ncbi:MAG TPA: hypothetical protein VMC82_01435 [Thermoplasmata archaeon]|nr:hypothetical protein [Thermoplasmata archaeon]